MRNVSIIFSAALALSSFSALAKTSHSAPTKDTLTAAEKTRLFSSPEFDQAVESAIQRFIEKEKQKREQAQKDAMNSRDPMAFRPISKKDHVYGDVQAPYTLLVYSDYECFYCQKFFKQIFSNDDQSLMSLVNKGQLNIIYRHVPFHGEVAQKESESAECVASLADSKAFYKMSEIIFTNTGLNNRGVTSMTPEDMALKSGLPEAKLPEFKDCLSKGLTQASIKADIMDAKNVKITGTPTSLLIGNKLKKAAFIDGYTETPLDVVKQKIEAINKK